MPPIRTSSASWWRATICRRRNSPWKTSYPPALVAWREGVESRLEAADLALSIVEPGIVYGRGGGIPASFPEAPKDAEGRLTVVGDGTQHWATVHVDDIADLYALIVDGPAPAGRVLGLSGQNPTVTEIGEAFAGGPVVPEGVASAMLDVPTSSAAARPPRPKDSP